MQIATEFQAVPQRYILGVTKGGFGRRRQQVPTWGAYLSRVWALANDQANGPFPAAELRNITDAITQYGKLAASLPGVPLS